MLVPRSIAALAAHTDNESTRYALGGIRLERDSEGKPHAVATDGRRLVHVTWSEDPDHELPLELDRAAVEGFETILPTKPFVDVCKAVKPLARHAGGVFDNILVEEPTANGTVKIGAANMERRAVETVQSVEGRFPRWRDVFPQYLDHAPGGYKPGLGAFEYAKAHWLAGEMAIADKLEDPDERTAHRNAAHAYLANLDPDSAEAHQMLRHAVSVLLYWLHHGAATITLNPQFLAEVCQTARAVATSTEVPGVDVIVPFCCDRPALVKAGAPGMPKLTAVIMPLAKT